MVLLKYKEKEFSIDGYLNSNLDLILNEAIPYNWDCFGIIFGREGTGKTTLATQICYKLDPNFSVKNIVWTPKQFEQAIDNAEDESSILWDEAITGARANQHGEDISKTIISKLTMIRKKKLKIIICFPYLYMLNKYFVSRCLFSIYCYAKGFGDRGYAKAYNSRRSEILYNLMKEKYRYDYAGAFKEAKYNYRFRFTKKFCADEEEYDLLKTKYSRLGNDEKKDKEELYIKKLNKIFVNILESRNSTQKEIAKYFDVSTRCVEQWVSKYKKKEQINFNIEDSETTIPKTNINKLKKEKELNNLIGEDYEDM